MATTSGEHGRGKHEPQYELPTAETLREAGDLIVKDEKGNEVLFKSLYEDRSGSQNLTIFIRHYFCGSCEDYIRTISQELPPSLLSSSTPRTNLTIIGCGDVTPIPSWRTRTMHNILGADTGFPVYTDPSRKLYAKLGMLSSMSTGDSTPSYVKQGPVKTALLSMKAAMMDPTNVFSGGSPSQLGGEMLFVEGEVVWFKRMRHAQDHAEVAELKEVLGLQ
ncbi:uncharacterized protein LTR77_009873 [Saxophila tyrrhenica]|uniref:Thioredoxin-like protein AAED1 n=1 Tax=Saxophila tyrrhenica TaxID=1690608 RepID=A0AAV9NXI8_9PEZI|nr:hypothetical protein LTR77_009873 [Saxophila tyrrhenica]